MSKIEHFCYQPQFEELYFTYPKFYKSIVDKFPSGSTFVEVGSWKGQSAAYMCVEIANSGKDIDFYCIDIWTVGDAHIQEQPHLKHLYNIFLANTKPVEKYYKPMKIPSVDASKKFKDESIDFVFIDAAHEYNAVKEDILAWYPKVKKGGILAGHDYFTYDSYVNDVYKVVNELFPNNHTACEDENCFIVYKN